MGGNTKSNKLINNTYRMTVNIGKFFFIFRQGKNIGLMIVIKLFHHFKN